MNKIILIGNLTKDPEIRVTNNGKKVMNSSIAISEGKDREVQYFNITAWEKTAGVFEQFCKKGSKVAVYGKLQTRSWQKPDGTKAYATDILVQEVELLGSKNQPATDSDIDEIISDQGTEIDVDSINVQMPF